MPLFGDNPYAPVHTGMGSASWNQQRWMQPMGAQAPMGMTYQQQPIQQQPMGMGTAAAQGMPQAQPQQRPPWASLFQGFGG